MSDNSTNNKRIAKNTILLYGRMLLIMAVSLYTSRVILNTLGIEDFGIYNVVGSVVMMFSFLNGAMVTSTQRYLTFQLGKGNLEKLKMVFITSIRIHLIIALIIVFLTETIGLWFFYSKMVIPEDRMCAAMWVLQLSVVTMIIQIMSVPYNSIIIAHEDMGVFAVISILEAVLKLLIAYFLIVAKGDKLITYAVLLAAIQLIIRIIYSIYCRKHYEETRYERIKNRELFLEMGKFAGWNIWGQFASMLMGTGVNMLLNVFFGPVVNAARAVAVQVESAVTQLSTNFLMAVNPQITKLYAQGENNSLYNLIYRSSKFTFFLLLPLSLPIILETDVILVLWLKEVPSYTTPFVRLLLLIMLIDATSRPLMSAAAASGNVKKYQSVLGGILLSIVPIAYIVLKFGAGPQSVYLVYLFIIIIAFIARLVIVKSLISLPLRQYVSSVVFRCIIVFCFSFAISYIIKGFMPEGNIASLVLCLISIFITLSVEFIIGLSTLERSFVVNKFFYYLKRI